MPSGFAERDKIIQTFAVENFFSDDEAIKHAC